MNEITRLFNNIIALQNAGALGAEFGVFADENPDCDSISDLNDIIESEISYWDEG